VSAGRAPEGDARIATTGIGWDSHRLVPGRPLILGGVRFPDAALGLDGHSDADVLAHAVIDALLGAAGRDDIGHHFPDTDATYAGADSLALLREVCAQLRRDDCEVVHVDTTVLMERPKLGPHRAAIRAALAQALGVGAGRVNVKASTGEGMGFVGRGEGVAALAVATLLRRPAVD
jgi:2-C-methyl-D-erythritol 2,4-cyclodiphosphate synthase